jgi:hypothetical protein
VKPGKDSAAPANVVTASRLIARLRGGNASARAARDDLIALVQAAADVRSAAGDVVGAPVAEERLLAALARLEAA